MPQVRILSLGPPFSEKPPKKAVFLRYKFGFRVSLDRIPTVVREVKIAVLSSVQKNAEISKIPNSSLTGVFSTFLCVGVT